MSHDHLHLPHRGGIILAAASLCLMFAAGCRTASRSPIVRKSVTIAQAVTRPARSVGSLVLPRPASIRRATPAAAPPPAPVRVPTADVYFPPPVIVRDPSVLSPAVQQPSKPGPTNRNMAVPPKPRDAPKPPKETSANASESGAPAVQNIPEPRKGGQETRMSRPNVPATTEPAPLPSASSDDNPAPQNSAAPVTNSPGKTTGPARPVTRPRASHTPGGPSEEPPRKAPAAKPINSPPTAARTIFLPSISLRSFDHGTRKPTLDLDRSAPQRMASTQVRRLNKAD